MGSDEKIMAMGGGERLRRSLMGQKPTVHYLRGQFKKAAQPHSTRRPASYFPPFGRSRQFRINPLIHQGLCAPDRPITLSAQSPRSCNGGAISPIRSL
jgi:hypothetical protein